MKNQIPQIAILIGLVNSKYAMAIPPWAKDGQQRNGNSYIVVCVGDGPSLDLARSNATRGCQSAASNQLSNLTRMSSLIVETDRDSALHQEIETNLSIRNLICKPLKEEIEKQGPNNFEVWLKCEFNLSSVEVLEDKQNKKRDIKTSNFNSATPSKSGQVKNGKYETSSVHPVLVSSFPSCSDILVRGISSRRITCNANPMTIVVSDSDKEIVIRSDGHKPSTIDLKKGIQNVQVFLDD